MASMNLHRVYIPTNARNNHYILAEFKPEESFYTCFDDIESAYQRLARKLFALCDEFELYNVQLIVNDKLPVVRYHEEAYNLQTDKQILFFYNPKYHEAHKIYSDKDHKARKIRLLFLATGDELRANAAAFHSKVKRTLDALQSQYAELGLHFRVRDHQHLTYDIFSKIKGHRETYGYKLRSLYPRYQARNCTLPEAHSEITYVSFSIPITRAIKTEYQHLLRPGDYASFYQSVEDKLLTMCSQLQLSHVGFVADGRMPIVRSSQIDKSDHNRELQKLSFDTSLEDGQTHTIWDPKHLCEAMHFVIVASDKDNKDAGYGKFVNNVETMVRRFTTQLPINPEKQDITMRFFQHISYTY
ncbi:DUF3083 family protein [Pseudoalteromonas luteoviolacea]|uniref:DUF3083 domain-containing protein n=1 Tax=Pseudoalteromonas luteoviolacea S4060-1 TaxID=1365257 RepID=A0A167IM43_9GAMM|nr:DUF3083 family protein [Pseudoalteromonas luteoviolacea]KZN59708.1 hypothetical protein N478_08295 [Pseudoalteromonas luteoviolacea S4060-1]